MVPMVLVLALAHPSAGFLAIDAAGHYQIHDIPFLRIQSDLTPEALDVQVILRAGLVDGLAHIDPAEAAAQKDGTWIHGDLLLSILRERFNITIDELPVQPRLKSIVYRKGDEQSDYVSLVHVTLTFGLKGPPRQISYEWKDFPSLVGWLQDTVEVLQWADEDGLLELGKLTKEEPIHIWHAPAPKVIKRAPPPLPPPPFKIPLAAIGLGIATLSSAFLLRNRLSMNLTGLLLGGGLVFTAAALFAPPLTIERAPPPLNTLQAQTVFQDLLRNVYRAFDYEDEVAIYDTLKESVTDEVIDGLYSQVYESLVLRDEGGAVSKPKAVNLEEIQVLDSELDARVAFKVRARWLVQGIVTHLGHQHVRTNRHEAEYEIVRHKDEAWRIGGSMLIRSDKLDPQDLQKAQNR